MIQFQHPFIHDDGRVDPTLIKTYTDDATKLLKQVETGIVYGESCVDVYPCRYTYVEVDRPEPEPEPEAPETNE